ncbi:hypothetical protein D9M71_809760 [compost metagenome]
MADRAPMPGSTPMRLPTSTPKNDHMRLCHWKATPKPYQRSIKDWEIMVLQPQRNSGNCNCSAHQKTTTAIAAMAIDSRNACLIVFLRSPSAEMNTMANMAGSRPP